MHDETQPAWINGAAHAIGELRRTTHGAIIPPIVRENNWQFHPVWAHDCVMPPAKHVIIRGQVFLSAEKEPFVASGVSFLGAVEYNQDTDQLRCHECGEYFSFIAPHAKASHGMTSSEYKRKHGIRLQSPLTSLFLRQQLRDGKKAKGMSDFKPGHRPLNLKPGGSRGVKHHEVRNVSGRCQAQTLFRIQTLAATLGRTPTTKELDRNHLDHAALRRQFGGIPVNEIIAMAGLRPNESSRHVLDERMPWPEDYFKINP